GVHRYKRLAVLGNQNVGRPALDDGRIPSLAATGKQPPVLAGAWDCKALRGHVQQVDRHCSTGPREIEVPATGLRHVHDRGKDVAGRGAGLALADGWLSHARGMSRDLELRRILIVDDP